MCSLEKSIKNVGQILRVSDFSPRNLRISMGIICFIDLTVQDMLWPFLNN